MRTLVLILMASCALMCDAELTFQCGEQAPRRISPVYSMSFEFQDDNLTMVPIQISNDVFMYCDITLYNPDGIRKLLESYNIQSGDRWVALFDNTRVSNGKIFRIFVNDWWIFLHYRELLNPNLMPIKRH